MIYEIYADTHDSSFISLLTIDLIEVDDVIAHVNNVFGSDNWNHIRIHNEMPNGLPPESSL